MDYYPFGMQMPGREFSAEEYRYGFQGQETDKEWLGGAVSYKYRVHDARIGRFLSVDPLTKKYPHYTPYSFSGNRVIDMVELEGLEPAKPEINGNVNLSVTVGKNPQAKLTVTGSVGFTGGQHQLKTDFSLGLYKGGLGTSRINNGFGFDFSANITGTAGSSEKGAALPQYTLNSETQSGFDNPFKYSLTYGQMVNFNSATNSWTRQGIVGFRVGKVGITTSNDSQTLYKGGGTDQGWTGSFTASIDTPLGILETGYQSFTGIADDEETVIIEGKPYYMQKGYQASLNRATTFIRLNNSVMLNSSFYSDGWLQHLIHDNKELEINGIGTGRQTSRFIYGDYTQVINN